MAEEVAKEDQSQAPETWEEKLAAYPDLSSQNAITQQVIMVLALIGFGYGKEVIDAYNFLKKPLDPKKLVEDPEYKRRVERVLQLVKRHEGSRLKETEPSKYKGEVKRTETALGQVNKIHQEQIKIKTGFSEPYVGVLRSVYGLEDNEIKSIYAAATERIKDNPTLSMQDALRIETREVARKKIEAQAKKEAEFKKLDMKQKEEEVKRRLAAKDAEFREKTSTNSLYENGRCEALRQEGKRQVAQTLGVGLKPPVSIPSPQPIIPKLLFKFALPKISLPKIFLPPGLSNAFSSMGSVLSGLGKVGNLGLGSIFKTGVSKIGGGLLKSAAIKLGLGAATGGVATIASFALDILNQIPGIKTVIDITSKTVTIVILLIITAPFLLMFAFMLSGGSNSNILPYFGSENAIIVASSVESLSWQEFEKKYLVISEWSRFEKENLIPLKTYLTSELNEITQ